MTLTPRLVLLLATAPLMWAGNAVVGRLLVGQVPPVTLNLLRWSVVALLLLPLGWRALRSWPTLRARFGHLLLLGTLGVGLYNTMQYLALVTSSPINVTLVASSMPVWMLAVGWLAFRVQPTRHQLIGAVIGLAGVLVVIGRGSFKTLLGVRFVAGDLYIVIAAVGWAFYSWMLAKPPPTMLPPQRPTPEQGWDWAGFLLVQTVFGLIPAAAFSAVEQAAGTHDIQWSPGVLAAWGFVAIAPSIVAYRCWGLGVAAAGPAVAAFFNNLTPLFAALLSAWVLGEGPQPYHALAFALIVGGIVVSTRGNPRPA
jgi:drug/metabolite transporter (DMT)-like permease